MSSKLALEISAQSMQGSSKETTEKVYGADNDVEAGTNKAIATITCPNEALQDSEDVLQQASSASANKGGTFSAAGIDEDTATKRSRSTKTFSPRFQFAREERTLSLPGAFHVQGINSSGPESPDQSCASSLAGSDEGRTSTDLDPALFVRIDTSHLVEAHLVENQDIEKAHVTQELHDLPVVATKDTFLAHLKHSRQSQAIMFVMIILLSSLGLGIGGTLSHESQKVAIEDDTVYRQVGSSLDGPPGSEFGSVVAMSSPGTHIAVAGPGGSQPVIRVYKLVPESDGLAEWTRQGSDILVESQENTTIEASLASGHILRTKVSLAISSDGGFLAIGLPFHNLAGQVVLYSFNSDADSWQQQGALIGSEAGDMFGAALALSADGRRMAVGIPGADGQDEQSGENLFDAGAVQVYEWNAIGWNQLGRAMEGAYLNEFAGISVSLSRAGDVVAVGLTTTGGAPMPTARVYDWLVEDWQERGLGAGTSMGSYDTAWNVVLSADGDIIVSSNYYLDGDGLGSIEENDALFFTASRYNTESDQWTQLGGNIHRNSPGPKSGYIISLSDDGTRVAMGDPGRPAEGGGADSGHAHLYEFDGANWCQIGPNKYGENAGDSFGFSIAISQDGSRIAMGAPYSRFAGPTHGRVQVYDILADRAKRNCSVI